MEDKPTVFVVDDDEAVRQSLQWLIEADGTRVECFSSAQEFLGAYDRARPGCVVLDVRMPGMNGLDVQKHLASVGAMIPVIVISGHADVSTAVQAMRSGAIDFLEKPFADQALLDRIKQAIELDRKTRFEGAIRDEAASCYEQLTPREREMMALVVAGLSNRRIAARLNVTQKTVEVHRSHVMRKMRVGSTAELARLSVILAGGPDQSLPYTRSGDDNAAYRSSQFTRSRPS